MIKISEAVAQIIEKDDLVKALAGRNLLNTSAYAREIKPEIESILFKDVKLGSIIAAVSRYVSNVTNVVVPDQKSVNQISVHANLEGLSFERTEAISSIIRDLYKQTQSDNKSYLTVTQGVNEITIIAEGSVAQKFRNKLKDYEKIYDKTELIGITAKFSKKYLSEPNLIYALTRRLALKNINVIEIVSTATELTFIIAKKDLAIALEQLQKSM